jgi:outer membrane protein
MSAWGRVVFFGACLAACRLAAAAVPPRTLTLAQAVAQALAHQPQLAASRAQAAATLAGAQQSRAALLPQLAGTAAYSRSTANYVLRPGSLPANLTPGQAELTNRSYNYFNFGVSAQQLIYDFGQTSGMWSAAQHKVAAQDANVRVVQQGVVLAARNAFFVARAQKELMQVAEDTLANQGKHRQQTQGFVQVGTQPQIALAQASTDFANAKVQRITATNNYASARAQLNQAMGTEQDIDYDVADDTLPEVPGEQAPTDALMREALAARPEFAAAEASIRAQQRTVSSLKGSFGPAVSATAQFTDAGTSFARLGWNWTAGANLSWPLFAGGLNYYQVVQAQATLAALQANLAASRQQVRLQVEQARLGVVAAVATLEASEEALYNAQQQLALAEGRYETGVGGMIELGDAQVAQTTAAGQRVQARFALAQARATLLQVLGRDG